MKITLPLYSINKCSDRAAFKRNMLDRGFRVKFHEHNEFSSIWDMYDSEDNPIQVVTIDSGVRKETAKKDLLEYVRDDYLGFSKKKFSEIIESRILLEDPEQENVMWINFFRLEKLQG